MPSGAASHRYQLENRYQDSGWEDMGESFDSRDDAVWRAAEYSSKGMYYGMVRVIDGMFGVVVITFAAA